jgi:hypothetical protein
MADALGDRIRIDYTADVGPAARYDIVNAVRDQAASHNLYVYEHYDKTAAAWSIDVTAHDRTRSIDVTDGQIVEYLKSIADERGTTIGALLREAAKIELTD